MAQGIQSLTVLVDTREQKPWAFSQGVATLRATLPSGDYSILGQEKRVAIERKSLDDLLQSLTHSRERFMAEIERLSTYDFAAVFVEDDLTRVLCIMQDKSNTQIRSKMEPSALVGSCAKLTVDYGVPVIWTGSRPIAEAYAERMLGRIANSIREGRPFGKMHRSGGGSAVRAVESDRG